jgi:hypothetical protein
VLYQKACVIHMARSCVPDFELVVMYLSLPQCQDLMKSIRE